MKVDRIAGAACLLFVSVLARAPAAQAQPAGTADPNAAQADRLFNEGVTASEAGDFLAALRAFQASYDLSPAPDTLYNIGMCHRALGNTPAAANAFQQYVLTVEGRLTDEERAEFTALLGELAPQIGRLAIQTTEAGAAVRVDDADAGPTPRAGWYAVEPGSHAVTVTKDGFAPASTVIDVPAGALVPLTMTLVALEQPPTGAGTEEDASAFEPAGELSPWFWASVGVAGAATLTLAITGGLTISYRDDFVAGGAVDADLRDTTIALRTATDVLLGVALAAVAAGTVLFFVGRDDESSAEETPAVTAALLPSGLVLAW